MPDTPDVLGMLRRQVDATSEGINAFSAWAQGELDRADEVREAEHACDDLRRTLVNAVREAFTTPLEPEDLFELSQDLDRVINGAKNTVREAEAMGMAPDAVIAEMAVLLSEGMHHLRTAFDGMDGKRNGEATTAADAAVKSQRRLERVYRHAMSELSQETDLRLVVGRQELYRRLSAMSDDLVGVAERIWYSTVKEA
jgi:uncharacterized protein Yka (UPF0111/DUF47 family)